MAWDLDQDVVVEKFILLLDEMVGSRLSFLKDDEGVDTTLRSIIKANDGAAEPPLPFITLNYEGDNNNDGFLLETSVEEVANLDGTFQHNSDILTYYGLTIRCEGEQSASILKEIRKKFLLERYRADLRSDDDTKTPLIYSTLSLISPVRRIPDLLDTGYREVNSMLLSLSTIDRVIENIGVVETLEYAGTIQRINDTDPDPRVIERTVSL